MTVTFRTFNAYDLHKIYAIFSGISDFKVNNDILHPVISGEWCDF